MVKGYKREAFCASFFKCFFQQLDCLAVNFPHGDVTASAPLLGRKGGNLREPGYAKRLLPIYRRADIKAPAVRIKEWDYYLVANDHFAVALTIDDNGYMGLDSISLSCTSMRAGNAPKAPCGPFPWGKPACRSRRTGAPPLSPEGAMPWCSGMCRRAGS